MRGLEQSEAAPCVSVIVPIYNAGENLRVTLESLKAQDLKDAEFILVDDGSTDGSLAVCREFAADDPRFRVLTGPNGGVCVARNKGLDAARGKWIAFCDADDRVRPEIYTTLLDLAAKEDAELVSGAVCDIGPNKTTSGILDFPISGDAETIRGRQAVIDRAFYPLLNNLRTVRGYLVCSLFRRDLVKARKLRFCPGVRMCEDEMFLLDYLLSVKTFALVRRDLYDYIRLGTSGCSHFFLKADDFHREHNWYKQACERERIFFDSSLAKNDPKTLRRLRFHTNYHEAQSVCCDPKLTWREKFARLRDLRARVVANGYTPPARASRIYSYCLLHALPLLPLLLWAKRRKDKIKRAF